MTNDAVEAQVLAPADDAMRQGGAVFMPRWGDVAREPMECCRHTVRPDAPIL